MNSLLETVPSQISARAGAASDSAQTGGLRTATVTDVPALFSLIERNLEAGHLLPRRLDELVLHADRFVVATEAESVAGCAELAPLSRGVAEVRSLVVDEHYRGAGLGGLLVDEIKVRARRAGHQTLCAFTHQPGLFVRLGFSLVPHVWLPEKIATDCHVCPAFRRCGQHAMVFALQRTRDRSLVARSGSDRGAAGDRRSSRDRSFSRG